MSKLAMVLLGGLMVSKGFLMSRDRGGVTLPKSGPGSVTSADAVAATEEEVVVVDELAMAIEGATCGGGGLSNLTSAALPAAAAATNNDDVAAGDDFLLFLLPPPPAPSKVADFNLSGVSSLVGWCLRMCSTNLSDLMVPN